MAKVEYRQPQGTFFNVLSDGNFHQTVTKDTPGAVLRTYKTSDDKEGQKWELVAGKIEGIIDAITIYEGDYGKNILVHFQNEDDDTDAVVVSLSASSPFGESFLHKVSFIKKGDTVLLSPYSFEDDRGKRRSGISIVVDGNKLESSYTSYDKEKKETIYNGDYPQPEGDTDSFDSDDWKMYFTKCRKYMMAELEKHELFSNESYEVSMATPVKSEEADVIDF